MAWEGPHPLLPPVLLLLLASGSWVNGTMPEELHKHPGQTLLLQCQYSPKTGPYQSKTWCQQTSPDQCTILVTSSKPWTAVQKSRYTIWDEPDTGFFNITMIQLTQNDSGFYWCGIYNTSKKVITVLRDINLVVSPAPTTSPMWTFPRLATSTVLITSPEGTSSHPSINGSQTRKSSAPACLGSGGPSLLVSVLCGLLMAKGLML
ncbi:PREDICTED: trem-like transcript 4 protein [Colobus angolensis palliatus]|uniref:trem-like transcript 4 protein n=1 Tax=Colobus angolensis palliatus TaxID=336983 RepID=UPI0005F5667D|nr:PREDICTED: trem-like transcript 4 protein [Colobus angolensis palliatus]XP_011799379.1 PREDICTED: trem-like transcript 4 protein [Colobus angolensis palliatus]